MAAHPDLSGASVGWDAPGPPHAGVARLVIVGALDGRAAAQLCRLCEEGAAGGMSRLELDLSGITATTAEGVAAVGRCLALRRELSDGVGVVVANDVGRRVLLESMSDA